MRWSKNERMTDLITKAIAYLEEAEKAARDIAETRRRDHLKASPYWDDAAKLREALQLLANYRRRKGAAGSAKSGG